MRTATNDIDEQMRSWRQGDVVLGADVPFIHLADLRAPCTDRAYELAAEPLGEPMEIVPERIEGFAVLTQTCDLVRIWRDRPYVEICPVVTLTMKDAVEVQRGYRPRFAPLPAIVGATMAADLDRVMTVEKGLLAAMTNRRVRGVESEQQARFFADMLGRKRIRPALPDRLAAALGKFHDRIKRQHGKASPEGLFLAALHEIRVRAIPDWSAAEIEIQLLFVFDSVANIPLDAATQIEILLERVERNELVIDVAGRPVGLDSLSAAAYLDSDRLDLDHLSQSA